MPEQWIVGRKYEQTKADWETDDTGETEYAGETEIVTLLSVSYNPGIHTSQFGPVPAPIDKMLVCKIRRSNGKETVAEPYSLRLLPE